MDTVHLLIYVTRILCNYMTAFFQILQNATVVINALQNLQSALSCAVLYIARPSVRLSPFVRPSVTRVDQSKTVGEDYAIFTVQCTCSSCGISFIQKFWRIPLSGASNKGGDGNELFSIALCVHISKKIQD